MMTALSQRALPGWPSTRDAFACNPLASPGRRLSPAARTPTAMFLRGDESQPLWTAIFASSVNFIAVLIVLHCAMTDRTLVSETSP